jgi:hypothetical protein
MKKWPTLVETMVTFFEQGFEREEKLRLVTLLWNFDYRQKTLPMVEELQQAIEIFGDVSVVRQDGEIYFVRTSKLPNNIVSSPIINDELNAACKQYSKEFRETYEKISRRGKNETKQA